jgi:hypothetical protein
MRDSRTVHIRDKRFLPAYRERGLPAREKYVFSFSQFPADFRGIFIVPYDIIAVGRHNLPLLVQYQNIGIAAKVDIAQQVGCEQSFVDKQQGITQLLIDISGVIDAPAQYHAVPVPVYRYMRPAVLWGPFIYYIKQSR